ncbi:MAG: phenylalanine--tRNA ligase subunit alpha [Anaerolineales bacterium]|nr:phenylalanine--tRNA ligase subunit alpha [Anaerolineales bacterium]MCW5855328.1 phenylalanine--tRNA ligase subunit alpha [Anaerolineales bacterium]
MLAELDKIHNEALTAATQVNDQAGLEEWRSQYLGKNAVLTQSLKQLGGLSAEERPQAGQKINQVKQALEAAFEERKAALQAEKLQQALDTERLDVTLPGRALPLGRLHPITQTLRRINAIFAEMGFQVYRSRDVETDEYNFLLLNFPPNHPAREMQDSFYVEGGSADNPLLMRTHTSAGQIHAMREFSAESPDNPPPVRIVLPGMCYRYEQVSARSEVQFTQVEGLAVGEDITFGDLKGTLTDFARRFFNVDVRTRFRASHFPFTEPSAEMDVECFVCGGKGCSVCKHSGWLEILGSGMVHPNVLRNGGYDPERYSGFAFGMGPERLTMLRYRIEDIRYFWRNDLRFLEQF